jgi:hypothetical protein
MTNEEFTSILNRATFLSDLLALTPEGAVDVTLAETGISADIADRARLIETLIETIASSSQPNSTETISEITEEEVDVASTIILEEGLMNEPEDYIPYIPPIIEPNYDALSVRESTSRFSGATWFEEIQKQTVTVAGLGGIGSYVAFLLARLWVERIYMYDDDIVEAANMSGQLYGNSSIGQTKVDATATMISELANYHSIVGINEKVTRSTDLTNIVITGFDNMEARKATFDTWKRKLRDSPDNIKKNFLLIDGRLAAEEYQILTIQGDDERAMEEYERVWLFSSSEAESTVCSYKQTTFMANKIASDMVNIFVNWVYNRLDPIMERPVPFLTNFSAETMYLDIVL